MDRVLLCTAQVKTKQRELSRETVTDLLRV